MDIPEHMRIVHHRDWCEDAGGLDETYFRLKHDLKQLPAVEEGRHEILPVGEGDFDTVGYVIGQCYPGVHMTGDRIRQLTQTPVYDPELWVLARRRCDGAIAGCAIGDLDAVCREGILEWVQVLPEHRRQGVGTLMVSWLLEKMAKKADFATVSGRTDNQSHPERLYRKCGFSGDDIWHIIR